MDRRSPTTPLVVSAVIVAALAATPQSFAYASGRSHHWAIVRAVGAPNDVLYKHYQRKYLALIKAAPAWNTTHGSPNTTIAIIDSGVDLNHPEFKGEIVPGYDFVNNDPKADDDNGHGTFVAGVAAAIAGNHRGVAGMAWRAKIMPVKVLGADDTGNQSDEAAGITWATDHGADVINLSISSSDGSPDLQSAVDYALSNGVVVVAASGNDGKPQPSYPAAYDGVIAVTATDSHGQFANFSNSGDWVDLAAPGVDIESTFEGKKEAYASGTGTSFAAPLVAGAAALVRAQFPGEDPQTTTARLEASAKDKGASGFDNKYGYGLLDVAGAVTGAGFEQSGEQIG